MQIALNGQTIDEIAIDRIQAFVPPEGYYLAFSGGKDSVVLYDLTQRAGVAFDAHYSVSPIDPPEIYRFIKEHYPTVAWDIYARHFWKLVSTKGLPLRTTRWCCEEIKEAGGNGRCVLLGIRWAESNRRRSRGIVEACTTGKGKRFVNPIIDWSDADIWQYIRERQLPYCSLYDEGYKRLGCVLCPFVHDTKRAIARWPKISNNWKAAAYRYWQKRRDSDKPLTDATPTDYWQWWLRR